MGRGPSLRTGEAVLGVLCPTLTSLGQERPRHTGKSLTEDDQGDQRSEATILCGEVERVGIVWSREEKTAEYLTSSLPVHKGSL